MSDVDSDREWERECLRLYRRYAIEIVERLGFCPYAERCREEGHTREVVMLDHALDHDRAIEQVRVIARDENIEVALLIWPKIKGNRIDLARFVETLRAAHQRDVGGLVMAMEGFHPIAVADLESAERLVPFVRRTPDPTIQLVRHTVLERVRRGTQQGTAFFDPSQMNLDALLREPTPKPIHERIAEANHATVVRLGVDEVAAILDDIRRDRDATYAALRH